MQKQKQITHLNFLNTITQVRKSSQVHLGSSWRAGQGARTALAQSCLHFKVWGTGRRAGTGTRVSCTKKKKKEALLPSM